MENPSVKVQEMTLESKKVGVILMWIKSPFASRTISKSSQISEQLFSSILAFTFQSAKRAAKAKFKNSLIAVYFYFKSIRLEKETLERF